MLASVRLDPETERLLARLARESGRTRSEVIRDAIVKLGSRTSSAVDEHPYAAAADLVGSVRGGPADLSARTGERFRDLLLRRRRPTR
jgi:predicted DNA-binding protein